MYSLEIKVTPCKSQGMVKCPRCLHYHSATANFGHREGDLDKNGKPCDMSEKLCNECTKTLLAEYPEHESIPYILANIEARGLTIADIT